MKLKKIALSLLVGLTVFTSMVPVHAEKKSFAFTTNAKERRTAPALKGDLEQNAYVTTTYHSTNKGISINVDNGSNYGIYTAAWTFTKPLTGQALGYNGYATKAYTYYLHYDPRGGVGTTVRGR